MKKKLISMILAASVAASAFAPAAMAEEESKVLTFAIASECETLDPSLCNYLKSSTVLMNVFMGLYMMDEDGVTLTNGCAESYEVSDDGLVYTFHLYDDVLWSDGSAVTAGDFEYAWKRTLNPETASTAANRLYAIKNAEAYNSGECEADEVGVTAEDDTTLVVELENPTAYFIEETAEVCYSPVKQSAVESSDNWSQEPENYVCNGAFVISEINPEESYVLVKNENYKYIDTIAIDETDIVFVDSTATLTALKNGEIDMTNNISTQAQSELGGTDQLLSFETLGTSYYDFNCENLTDARVRKALSLAIDRDTITQSIVSSKPESATGFVPSGLSYYDSEDDFRTVAGDLLTYDVETAQALVEEAVADGFDIDATYTFITQNDDELKTIAQAIQSMWKENLGINFEIVTYESGSYWDVFYAGDFDIAYDGWTGDYDDPSTMLECFALASCATQNRWSGELAEEYDQMLDDADAMTDQAERYALYVEAEELLIEESPILPLYFRKSQLLVGTNVTRAVNDNLGHTLFKYTILE
ncbi:MAG: peptide ABC transporter substrate-binding protein [Clostridiales bacterium]|nr:peptide ABC transporter substrate-binding protein [Clostridiales bacterium]